MSTTETPVLPPWMDKKMLEVWLRRHYGEVAVTDCEVKKGTNKGDNYLSNMHRLVVTTKSGDIHHLVIKCRMEEGEAATIMSETSIYRREQEMYANTLPKMSALLQKAMPGNVAFCIALALSLFVNKKSNIGAD
jgi:Mg2+/citrate symporter